MSKTQKGQFGHEFNRVVSATIAIVPSTAASSTIRTSVVRATANCILASAKPGRLRNAYSLFDRSPERVSVLRNDLGLNAFMSYPEKDIRENGDFMPNEISGCVM